VSFFIDSFPLCGVFVVLVLSFSVLRPVIFFPFAWRFLRWFPLLPFAYLIWRYLHPRYPSPIGDMYTLWFYGIILGSIRRRRAPTCHPSVRPAKLFYLVFKASSFTYSPPPSLTYSPLHPSPIRLRSHTDLFPSPSTPDSVSPTLLPLHFHRIHVSSPVACIREIMMKPRAYTFRCPPLFLGGVTATVSV